MNKTVVETPEIPAGQTDATATEALAGVATAAIEETAARIDALAQATAELRGARDELGSLREAFHEYVEGRQVDFIAVTERLAMLESGLEVMREAQAATVDEVEELAEEIDEVEEIEEIDTVETVNGAADVSAALHEEPQAPTLHEEIEEQQPQGHRPGGRHFVRI